MSDICVLQLGDTDWRTRYTLPDHVDFEYASSFTAPVSRQYDIVFLDRAPLEEELPCLFEATKTYTLYVTDSVELSEKAQFYYDCRKGQRLPADRIGEFLEQELRFYFGYSYGEKLRHEDLSISSFFAGEVKWNGHRDVTLSGVFGEDFRQIAFWRYNTPVAANQPLDLWLEYGKTSDAEIALTVTGFAAGSQAEIISRRTYTEEELVEPIRVGGDQREQRLFLSIEAKGAGEIRIISLHSRYSRGSHGAFLPGGERYVTADREEVFAYFDPADMQPPLNVYFSGYKQREGFEGVNLMRRMGCPYLLLSESRLEGGGFYIGSAEYERMITGIIRKYMTELGFGPDQVIFSGLSMGTFGALYYGCEFTPHAMLLGKPLASVGDIATNETLVRPGGFPTSLDVLLTNTGGLDGDSVRRLNERFWNRFDAAVWNKTKFVVAYMIEDDYDQTAYEKLISHVRFGGVQIYGKGLHGRHNDNSGGIVSWFAKQYRKILQDDFGRAESDI